MTHHTVEGGNHKAIIRKWRDGLAPQPSTIGTVCYEETANVFDKVAAIRLPFVINALNHSALRLGSMTPST